MANEKNGRQLVFEGSAISKTYRTRAHSFTLSPVDVKLHAGEITAVVGENGDGKTTLLSMIGGRLSLTAGKTNYPLVEQNGAPSVYQTRQTIAMLTQELPEWNGRLVDNLHFYAALRDIRGTENQEWVAFILERLGLTRYAEAAWTQISGGYRTRFSLARALVQKPNLLVLDEPLSNLDINTQLVFLDDLRDLVKSLEQPIAMVISSQHLHEIETITDNIIFIRDGETLYNGAMADFEANREDNVFELTCDLPPDKVERILKKVKLAHIRMAGETYLLHFPRKVESAAVLRALLDSGARISLFRDISQSTRKLFQVEG